VVFAVKDSGIGMAAEQMGRLFQASRRPIRRRRATTAATGLGLTITRHSAPCSAGRSTWRASPGRGLDLHHHAAGQRPGCRRGSTAHVGPVITGEATGATVSWWTTIPSCTTSSPRRLAKEGYRVVHARNGAEALRLAREVRPDAITLDVMMPQVDGWSVLGQLKSDRRSPASR
jgi:hypothetical protein